MSDLVELLRIESQDMINEFKKASIKGKGTPQEVSDFRELYFHSFISKYFPFPYRITKGGIIDTYGNKSASIDCIICNPAHPYTVDNTGKFSVILADGVDSAIEIKPDIGTKDELERGLKQIISVKKLRRSRSPIVIEKRASKNEIEFSKTIPSFIFSLEAKADIDDTVGDIIDFYKDNKVSLDDQVDYIIINNFGILINYKFPEANRRAVREGVKKYGYYFEEWGDLTLAVFLLYINMSYGAVPTITSSILQRYLYKLIPKRIARLEFDDFW